MMNLLLGVVARPESATELCLGPGRCRTGKTGIEKSSSSFQVNFLSFISFYDMLFNFDLALSPKGREDPTISKILGKL